KPHDRSRRRDRGLNEPQQGAPRRMPGFWLVGAQDLPGHGNTDAAVQHADTQAVEAVAEVGDIQGQGQAWARPERPYPAQQRSKGVSDVEVAALAPLFAAGLGARFLAEFAHTLTP